MWTCPQCQRSFKRRDQAHSCILITKESLFAKRPPALKNLYERVVKEVKQFGAYREETVRPDVIFLKTASTFLGIKIKKDHLEVEFFLDHLEDIPPVFKYLQTSKHRVVHHVAIDNAGDITPQLIRWMQQSYELVAR